VLTVRRHSPCPRRPLQLAGDPSPAQRMTRPCASRTRLSSCLPGHCRLTLWGNPGARAEPTWPRQAFSSIAANVPPVPPALLRRPLSGSLSTRPNVAGASSWPDSKKCATLPIADALRALSTVHEGSPRSWRVFAPPRRSPNPWGHKAKCIRPTRALVPESPACAHNHSAVHGPVDPGSPRVKRRVSRTLII